MKLTQKQKLEVGAYVVTVALAFPLYFLAAKYKNSALGDFLIDISATLAGAGFLFFLLNRFFGIEMEKSAANEQGGMSAEQFFKYDFDDLREKIRNAKSVCINGVTLSRSSNTYLIDLRTCIENGGSVKVVVVDPEKPAITLSAKREKRHQNPEKIRRECLTALDNFETLLDKPQNQKNFEIRLSEALPTFSIWIIDGESRTAEIWVEVYSFRGEKDIVFVLTPFKDGVWFDFFKQQFDMLWNDGTPWK